MSHSHRLSTRQHVLDEYRRHRNIARAARAAEVPYPTARLWVILAGSHVVRHQLTPDERAAILALRRQGVGYHAIARRVGRSFHAVRETCIKA